MTACLMGIAVAIAGAGRDVDNHVREKRYQYFPKELSGNLVVVAIDTPSVKQLGAWPWPRGRHGDLVTALDRAGAKRIAFDIFFDQPAADPKQDISFATALSKAKAETFLPALLENRSNQKDGYEALPTAALLPYVNPVSIWLESDDDQFHRRFVLNTPIEGQELPSIAQALNGSHLSGEGTVLIDWSYWPSRVPRISYSDVLAGKFPKDFFKGKNVLVGPDAFGLGEQYSVPYHNKVAGLYLFAVAAETLHAGVPVEVGSWPALILVLSIIALAVLFKTKIRYPLLIITLLALAPAQILIETVSNVRVDVGAAMLAVMTALVIQIMLSLAQSMLDRITKSAEAGLPKIGRAHV